MLVSFSLPHLIIRYGHSNVNSLHFQILLRLFSEIECDVFDCMLLYHKRRLFFLLNYFYFQRVNLVVKCKVAAMSTQPYKLPI